MSDWKRELKHIVETAGGPSRPPGAKSQRIRAFVHEVVVPAFEEVARELQDYGRTVEVEHEDRWASIRIIHGADEDFVYEVRVKAYRKPEFAFPVIPLRDAEGAAYRAEAGLSDRPLHQDVTNFTREQLIQHLLREYDRHLKWHL